MSSDNKRRSSRLDADSELKGVEAIQEIANRITGLFGNVQDTLDSVAKRADGDIKPFEAQVQWRVRSGGVEIRSEDGDSAATREAAPSRREAAAPAAREASIEVFDESDVVLVTAELPGVKAEDVSIEIDGLTLRLTARGARPFEGRAALPAEIDATTSPAPHLANGMLELRLVKKRAETSEEPN